MTRRGQEILAEVGRLWAQGLAAQQPRGDEAAARAAGGRSEQDVEAWVRRFRDEPAEGLAA
jgi:hypothetical protein